METMEEQNAHWPEVTKIGMFDMQVSVPKEWTDRQVMAFAEKSYPSGLPVGLGWTICKQGNPDLRGFDERTQCPRFEDHCYIILSV